MPMKTERNARIDQQLEKFGVQIIVQQWPPDEVMVPRPAAISQPVRAVWRRVRHASVKAVGLNAPARRNGSLSKEAVERCHAEAEIGEIEYTELLLRYEWTCVADPDRNS